MRPYRLGFARKNSGPREPRSPSWAAILVLGLLAGIAAGVLLGLLFAPASGRVTRHRVRRRVGDVRDRLSESANELEEARQDVTGGAGEQLRAARRAGRLRVQGVFRTRRKPGEV